MRLLFIVLVCFPLLHAQTFDQLARSFDYDSTLPLDVKEIGVSEQSGLKIHDITYSSPLGGVVPAYLVVPNREGPHAVILFGHWIKKGSPLRNRREFLDEAMLLGRAGAVSLLIDTPFVRPGFVEKSGKQEAARQEAEAGRQQVIDFRRGLDLLLARPDVDPQRIAYVGHSFDANVGAILAGVDKRIQSFVLMAGGYGGMMAYLPHSSPATVFLQFASQDQSRKQVKQYYDAFGEPRKIEIYDAGHALDSSARHDRVDWLVRRLALRPIDEAALRAIPPLK